MPVQAVATHWYEGKALKLKVVFTDEAGVPTNPTTVTLRYTPPGGPTVQHVWVADLQIVNPSAGTFYEVVATRGKSGQWAFDWYGTGVIEGADGGIFHVDAKYA